MKYTNKQYASALLEALKDKDEGARKEVLARFLSLLTKNRARKHLDSILKEAERQNLHNAGLRKVDIEFPHSLSDDTRQEIKESLGGEVFFKEKQNPDLLAGIKILIDDEILIDASAKRRLDNIFSK